MMVLFAPVSVTVTMYLERVEKKSIRFVPISELGAISDIEIGVSINGDEAAGRLPRRQHAKQIRAERTAAALERMIAEGSSRDVVARVRRRVTTDVSASDRSPEHRRQTLRVRNRDWLGAILRSGGTND